MTDTGTIIAEITALASKLQAQRTGHVLPERYRPRPTFPNLDDPDLLRRLTADVEGDDGEVAEVVKAIDSAVDPDNMTAGQAAQYLNITVDQVRGLASDGALRWFNTSRGDKRARYRFTQSDLDQFIADRRVQRAEPCPSTPRRSTKASTNSTSSSNVIGLMDRRAALLAARQNGTKL